MAQTTTNFDLPTVPEGLMVNVSFGKIWPEKFGIVQANTGKWVFLAFQGPRTAFLFEAKAVGRKRAIGEFREALKRGQRMG
jgi:hypothetical protein